MKTVRALGGGLLVGVILAVVGCGQSANETKPIGEVQSEAQSMDVSALRKMAMTYKDAIEAKMADVEKVQAKLKEISPMEMMGEEAKSLKSEIDAITTSVNALKERFQVYYNKLKELNGDLSGLEL